MTDYLFVGIHEGVSEARYHADPCETPSASSSILKTLIDRSPEHARWDHPRLNPNYEPEGSTEFPAAGSILHSLILGTPAPFKVLDFDAFRSNKAKAARDETIKAGLLPILAHKFEPLTKVADALRRKIAAMPEISDAIEASLKEVTLVWKERGSLCRCRFDLLPPQSFQFALDLKFTSRSAEPEGWGRTLVNNYTFQAALYPRAVHALRGDKPEFRFLVCETDPPYGVSLHAMDPQLEDLANRRLNKALALWRECTTTGEWPGYSTETHYQEPPPWELTRWEAREFRDSLTPGDRYARLAAAAGGPPL